MLKMKRQILNYGLFCDLKYSFTHLKYAIMDYLPAFSLPKSHNYGAISTQNHTIPYHFQLISTLK